MSGALGALGALCGLEKLTSLWDPSEKIQEFGIVCFVFSLSLLNPLAKYLPGGNAGVSLVFFLVGLLPSLWVSLLETHPSLGPVLVYCVATHPFLGPVYQGLTSLVGSSWSFFFLVLLPLNWLVFQIISLYLFKSGI